MCPQGKGWIDQQRQGVVPAVPQHVSAPAVKRYEQHRVVGGERRIIQGTAPQVEQVRAALQGAGVINTAFIERRNATFRAYLSALTRRGRALARHLVTLQHGMYLALASTGDEIPASRCKVAMPVAPFLGQYHPIEKAKNDAGEYLVH